MPKINSRDKGARGEREAAKILTEAGFPARRGQQFSGGQNSPDVVCESLSQFHLEVKRKETGNVYQWIAQALGDNPEKIPLVLHKKNDKEWLAILPLKDFLGLLK